MRGFADRSIFLALAAALAAGLGLFAAQRFFGDAQRAPGVSQPQLGSVTLTGAQRPVANFQLVASDGSALTNASLRGRWTLVFLGFTHCPDVCPTTLADLSNAQKSWASLANSVRPQVLFVSADPERDSPAKTGDYAHYFHPDTLAASGSAAQVAGFAQAMGLVYMKVPLEGDDYTMDHSATLVVLDPQGRLAGLVRAPLQWKSIAHDLRLLAEGER